jgi:C4-dicarboxylate-specific signal transduction histidine kinase
MQPGQDLPVDSLYQAMRRLSHVLAHPARAAVTSIGLVILIALLDFATGYEMRLAMLYTIPIALATWVGGARLGALTGLVAVVCWGVGFHPTHVYSNSLYYYWEALMLMMTFAIFILLLHSLRSALARADKRFLHVLEGLPAGIFVTDRRSGKLLYANRQFTTMVGEPVGERAAKFEENLQEHLWAPPQDNSAFSYTEARDEESGRWYLVQSGPAQWEDDRRVQLKVLMDITDSKHAEALRQQHHELLNTSARNAVLAEISSMLGHELNQPLMAIAAYLDASNLLLAKSKPDIKEVMTALQKSRAQVSRASDILEHTRSFLRRRAPSFLQSDINEVAREAVQALELEMQEAGIQVELALREKLPEVFFDSTLIQQVIINLLRNATEALANTDAPREILVSTTAGAAQALEVTVTDNGPGIPEGMADRLFTPFATTKNQGLGLGLCICRSIVEAHGGTLWYTPNEGGGSSFHFTLAKVRQHANAEN